MIERVHSERKKSHTGRILVLGAVTLAVTELLAFRKKGDAIPTISSECWKAMDAHPLVPFVSGVTITHLCTHVAGGRRGNLRVTLPFLVGAAGGIVAWGRPRR